MPRDTAFQPANTQGILTAPKNSAATLPSSPARAFPLDVLRRHRLVYQSLAEHKLADCAINYVGTCLFEGTNVPEGRGTTQPFSDRRPLDNNRKLLDGMSLPDSTALFSVRLVYPIRQYRASAAGRSPLTDRGRYQPFELALRLLDGYAPNSTNSVDRLHRPALATTACAPSISAEPRSTGFLQ